MPDSSKYSCLLLIVSVFLMPVMLLAQKDQLYMPLSYRQSYESGVRGYDGNPGPNYWINRADYDIKADFDPATGVVNGSEKVVYYNESPDSINQLVIKLLQDLYKIGNAHDNPIDPANLHQGIKIFSVKIDNQKLDLNNRRLIRRSGTNMLISLKKALQPGATLELEIDWELQMSRPGIGNRRTGGFDSTSWFVGYWYPQIAVYDDIDGWDQYDYTGAQETYNDFNNYKVSITVPATHMVWATGIFQNVEEVLEKDIVDRYRQAQTSDQVIQVITPEDLQEIQNKKKSHTFQFTADNVMDFAFATSDHFLWDVVSTEIGGRRVTAEAVYPPSAKDFPQVAGYAKETLEIFSSVFPGNNYPYPKHVTVNAMHGGGMEFPMMANNGSTSRTSSTISLTAHEIAHTYFPFYTGINERKYAWMDEGWAEYLADVVMKQKGMNESFSTRWAYRLFGGSEFDLPLFTPSVFIEGSQAVGFNFYFKPHLAYKALEQVLGKEVFDASIHGYIERWAGKHPTPYDFFFSVNDLSGEDLTWFWRSWFFEFGFADLAIGDVSTANSQLEVEIVNQGGLAIPVRLKVERQDSEAEFIERPIEVWAGGDSITIQIQNPEDIVKLELMDSFIPDLKQTNNSFVLQK